MYGTNEVLRTLFPILFLTSFGINDVRTPERTRPTLCVVGIVVVVVLVIEAALVTVATSTRLFPS